MEPFKNLLNEEVVRRAGHHLERAWPAMDRARFERLAIEGLTALEFKARAGHIATALEATLPDAFPEAATVLERSLAPAQAGPDADLGALRSGVEGLAGWIIWPMGEYVARRGLDSPERAFVCLHALTQRLSAEFAIRPFIERHPDLAFETLARWTRDPSPHVRRLVSEGSRPRLPWGLQLRALVRDPSPTLPLLRALQDDPSEYVRRSVANHLNDIARDHPGVVADWLERHLPGAPSARQALLRHASRTLIKRGDPRVLALWGLGGRFKGAATLTIAPRRVAVGGSITLHLKLESTSRAPQALEIDYRVHHVKADGSTSPKVFKGWRLTLAPGEVRELTRSHSLRLITTRRYFAGRHRVDVQLNGRVQTDAAFQLTVPRR